MNLALALSNNLSTIKKRRPLVLNITNFVAMDFSANALLALGASPIMTMDLTEIDELVAAADSVVINMGTLDENWLRIAKRAWAAAINLKKPVIFDPVGAGATQRRTDVARNLLADYGAAIVRGNASEILAVIADQRTTKGVDATLPSEDVLNTVRERVSDSKNTFVISGSTDYIFHSQFGYWVKNGDFRMTSVTAMGCVSTCIIAACRAIEPDSLKAAFYGMSLVGLCGEIAAEKSLGPASLRVAFLDLLANENLSQPERLRVGVL